MARLRSVLGAQGVSQPLARVWVVPWWLTLWLTLVSLGLFTVFRHYGYDDPFITYRYALNIVHGHGFVYNPGDLTLSTTTPLYTLIMAGAGWLGLHIPTFSNALSCVALAGSGLVLWLLGRAWQTPVAGAVAALLYPLAPLMVSTLGAETNLYMLLVLLGMLACARYQYIRMAVWLALATLVRADGALAVLAVGVVVLLRERGNLLRLPWHAAAVYFAVLVPWAFYGIATFGSPFPVTLAAKQQQGLMTISPGFLAGLQQQFWVYWESGYYRLTLLLMLPGLYGLLRFSRGWLLLVGWGLLYAVSYASLGISSYFWYYAPLVAPLIVLSALGVETVLRPLRATRWQVPAVAACVLCLLVPQLFSLRYMHQHPDERMTVYRATGEWLARTTPPDATVGTLEVGILGYYSQRPMVDFAGLIQPTVAHQMHARATYNDTAHWATLTYQPDYLVVRPGTLPALEEDSAVQQACALATTIEPPGSAFGMDVYACDWSDR